MDVGAIAKRPSPPRASQRWLHAPTLPSPASGGGKFLPQLSPKGAAGFASTSGAQAVEARTVFGGLSLDQNVQAYGQDQGIEPADAQPAGNDFYAPSLQYDWGSGRWFLGGIASNSGAHLSWLLLAVSRTASPLGTWSVTTTDAIGNNPSQCRVPCPNNDYFRRESIAVTGDKVVQAEQRVDCASGCNLNRPGAFVVMRKDQLIAGVQPTTDRFTLGITQTDFLAVQPQSVGGTYGNIAFLVWLKVGDPSPTAVTRDRIGLLQIEGLPAPNRINSFQGTTTVWEKDFSAVMPPLSISPAQPGGTLSASPTPITSAIYRDGKVVLAMNDNCGATPDPRQVYCVRIVKTIRLRSPRRARCALRRFTSLAARG